jgi:hypothetical protein
VIITVDAEQLAATVFAEAERHPARSPERRAAAHLWVSLITSAGISAARNAVKTFGEPEAQAAALELLGRLTREQACPQ